MFKARLSKIVTFVFVLTMAAHLQLSPALGDISVPNTAPHLVKNGNVTQLMVNGKPFLMLGGELSNSSSSSLAYMEPIWTHMVDLHANTVVTPLTWEMIEPQEGKYDFSLVDGLIDGARQHNLHLVFLWLASWKNGMTSYDPLWVKQDYKRFPLAAAKDGTPIEVLSTLSPNNWTADGTAFAALMKHIKEYDGQQHTVLMMQVENEVGILGDSRDRSTAANKAFDSAVPAKLMDYMVAHENHLVPELTQLWTAAGKRTSGTWAQVFGSGPRADEIFMAWHYARYIDHVAAAGKAEYDIPMYVNAWLNDPMDSPPGNYPSGCPEAQVMDIWQAGAPHINLLAPDLYAGNFEERCQLYTRQGNPLFIPEMNSDIGGARNIYLAVGTYGALGTSPFGIDHTPSDGPISQTYQVLEQIAPILLEEHPQGNTVGFVLDQDHPNLDYQMNGYDVQVSLDSVFGRTASNGAGVVAAVGPDKFIGAGSGFRVMFKPLTPGPKYAGIGPVEEGTFVDGKWVSGRHLNGDETDQGRSWRFASWGTSIETCTVYRYE